MLTSTKNLSSGRYTNIYTKFTRNYTKFTNYMPQYATLYSAETRRRLLMREEDMMYSKLESETRIESIDDIKKSIQELRHNIELLNVEICPENAKYTEHLYDKD